MAMDRIFLTPLLVTTFSLKVLAQDIPVTPEEWRPLGRYYKLVPEKEALLEFGRAREGSLNPRSIKALIWNIKKAELPTWDDEFSRYGANQDLYLVQEAYKSSEFTSTLARLPGIHWDFGISFIYRVYGDVPTGNMIGSRATPSLVKIRHTPDFEPVVETPKATTFARYPLEGSEKELLVISVHGINITTDNAFKRHMLQIKEEMSQHSGPILLAGDFNTRTSERTKFLNEMMKELNFTTVTFKNGEHRMRFKFTPYYLDHGFVRGLKVKWAEVYPESIGSDHKPMVIEMEAASL